MGQREKGLFRMIFRHFLNSITPTFTRTVCVGEDYHGTKYFEVPPSSQKKRSTRYFIPVNKSQFDQEMPAEWESWLRHRRDNPPTEEEVRRGYEMILTKRKNAAEIKTKFEKPGAEEPQSHSSHNFPVYEEYKNHGQDYKEKK